MLDTSSSIQPLAQGVASTPSGIDLAYEVFGHTANPAAETVVLVSGLGSQLVAWRRGFVEALVDAGLRVVRFDNRDVGLSSKSEGSAPDPADLMARAQGGADVSGEARYALADMANDTIALCDALDIERPHVAGVSMGGMIVQECAIHHGDRIGSATSIMSTTGDRMVGGATAEALEALWAPPPTNRDEAIEEARTTWAVFSGPLFDADANEERAAESFDRCFHPAGAAFQIGAVAASGNRTEALGSVDVPFLVIHGKADQLIHVSGGEATADAVPNADLLVLAQMGHDLPQPLWPQITGSIAARVATS